MMSLAAAEHPRVRSRLLSVSQSSGSPLAAAILHELGRIFEQRAMECAREILQRKRLGCRMAVRQIDRARSRRTGQLLHHAFHSLGARESSQVRLPAPRKRRASLGRFGDERPFADARSRTAARGQQLVGLRDGNERAIELARKLAHRRQTIAGM